MNNHAPKTPSGLERQLDMSSDLRRPATSSADRCDVTAAAIDSEEVWLQPKPVDDCIDAFYQ